MNTDKHQLNRLAGVVIFAGCAAAQSLNYTATTENVAGAPDAIRIDVLRWSTDAERDQMLGAWNLTGPVPARGPVVAEDPFGAGNDAAPAGGRGGRGRGGADRPRRTPEASLAAALDKAPTVGRLWSSETAGYSIRYAIRLAGSDGGERIVLITDRRLGAWNNLWKLEGSANNYDFSVIELRLNSKGVGEGKASLTGKLIFDGAGKTIALENYGVLPVVLKNVKLKGEGHL